MVRLAFLLGCLSLGLLDVEASPLDLVSAAGQSSHSPRDVERYTTVPNGKEWLDTDGNVIHAWGGNYYEEDSTFYWVGQNLPSIGLQSSDDPAMINLYKSTDLLNWDKVGAVITVHTPDEEGNQRLAWCRLERPKLMKSKATGKYVIWIHYETGNSYSASEVIVFTADNVDGPYTVTSKGHHRPGAGYDSPSAMGDRVGAFKPDYSARKLDTSVNTIAYSPVVPSYPPTILQYGTPSTTSPYTPAYVSASQYGTLTLSGVRFNVTMKAVAVEMTPWNATIYDRYKGTHSVSPASYIVRYATDTRSSVSSRNITIRAEDGAQPELEAPLISPTLEESSSDEVVLVNSGDAAFLTAYKQGTKIYYTTNGSDPTASSGTVYTPGTRLTISGDAGTQLEIKAIAVYDGEASEIASQVYEVAADASDVPLFSPVFNFASGTYKRDGYLFQTGAARVYSPSYNSNVYYTLDGADPDPPGLGYNLGYGSRDMTVWEDPKSGASYLITATDNVHTRFWQLTDDLTEVDPEKEYDVFVNESREAPALIRHGGANGEYVYMLTSTQSGWFPNQAQYVRSNDIEGGFSSPRDAVSGYRNGRAKWSKLSPAGDLTTYGSQPTWILNIGTDENPTYIYVGDRHHPVDLIRSTHIFTALYLDDDTVGEGGVEGSGNLTISFDPAPAVDVANGVIRPSTSKLLSRGKPVTATPSKPLTADQVKAGTYNFSASVANDGVNFDVNANDAIAQYYNPSSVPFFWQVDLEQSCDLSWAGFSFRTVSGSMSAYSFTVSGSTDNANWTQLVDNTEDKLPGFKARELEGRYRYVRLNVSAIWDVEHNASATWLAGVHEVTVNGNCGPKKC